MPQSKQPSAKQASFVNAETNALNVDLCAFLDSSPSPFHATRMLGHMLAQAGFSELDESEDWQLQPGQGYFVTRNQSSLVAWQQGDSPLVDCGWRMLGAHTDSPCLKLKPRPGLLKQDNMQLGVEVYGGALLNPWFDRDLSIAGRVHYLDSNGELRASLLDFARPLAVIPSLAIHLDREANENRSINAQDHLPVLIGAAQPEATTDFLQLLAEELPAQWQRDKDASRLKSGIATILDHELLLYDTQRAVMQGLRGEYIASARLDNLLSCYIDAQALLGACANEKDQAQWALLICSDHEEVGSQSAAGAGGPFLAQVLQRIEPDPQLLARALSRSMLISTDNAHASHPNYADKMDSNHAPIINAGPVIKVNANQRYASNSETQAVFRALCVAHDIPLQNFVMRSDMACGSTIGPITATELGIKTLDVGVPTLAMHSIRELAGSRDTGLMRDALQAFYARR